MEKPSPRQTKIVVTLGPASMVPEVLAGLVARGADVFRLNMAHADEAWVRGAVGAVGAAASAAGRGVPVMMDVKGPFPKKMLKKVSLRCCHLEKGLGSAPQP